MIRIAFLDRDGVINKDTGYVGTPEEFVLLPGVVDALRLLQSADYRLVVVTNQSGIGRGYFSEAGYERVTAYMRGILASHGVELSAVLHCPHLPSDGCACRKPLPGMLVLGARQLGAELVDCVMFGDKESDMAAGRAAGVGWCCRVGGAQDDASEDNACSAPDLLACARLLLAW